jgi:polysaccharide biosynthesis transport protein
MTGAATFRRPMLIGSESQTVSEPDALDIRRYFNAAGRHLWRIAAITALTVLTTLVIAMLLPRTYEASTRLLLDPRALQISERDATPRSNTTDQAVTIVESEMRVLTSDSVLLPVIDRLGLMNDVEFMAGKRYPWSFATDMIDQVRGAIRARFGKAEPPGQPNLAALRSLQQAVKVRREPLSFAIDLAVATTDPVKSARIANAIAEEYLSSRITSQSSTTQRASNTLTGRLDDLRQRAETADAAVERYKRDNGIVGAAGRLVNEQQLSEIVTQLSAARAETSNASARLEQIRLLRSSGVDLSSTREAVFSESVRALRTQYAQIRQREAALATTVLPGHPQAKRVRQELIDVKRSIEEEVSRIADAARLDLDRARTNEQAVEKKWVDLKTLEGSTNEKRVKLRELEREAEASRSIYASQLVRSRELAEQRQVDTSLASVISPAVPPKSANGLPFGLMLAASSLLGLGLGVASAQSRENRDPILRSADQINDSRHAGRAVVVSDVHPLSTFVVHEPQSAPSRAVMGLMADSLDADSRTSIILVTTTNADEYKSTIAINMALAAARRGERVLLIDGDADKHELTDLIHAADRPGLGDVLDGEVSPSVATFSVADFGLDIMPLGHITLTRRTARNLTAAIQTLGQPYDVVIVDGGSIPQGQMIGVWMRVASRILVVAQQGNSNRASLNDALASFSREQAAKTRTVVISPA